MLAPVLLYITLTLAVGISGALILDLNLRGRIIAAAAYFALLLCYFYMIVGFSFAKIPDFSNESNRLYFILCLSGAFALSVFLWPGFYLGSIIRRKRKNEK